MALPPGYLTILNVARALGWTEFKLSREEAVELERRMRASGWVIVPKWMVSDTRPAGVVLEHD